MRKLAFLLLMLLCLTTNAGQVHPYYSFSDYTLHPLNVTRVTVTPLARGADYDGIQLSQAPLIYTSAKYPTLTNGTITISNLVAGYAYRVEFSDGYGLPTITNYFATNLSGVVSANTNKGVIISQTGGVVFQFAYYYQYPTNVSVSGSGQTNWPISAITNLSTTSNLFIGAFTGDGGNLTNLAVPPPLDLDNDSGLPGVLAAHEGGFSIGTNLATLALLSAQNVFTASNTIAGSFTGNGAGLTNIPYDGLSSAAQSAISGAIGVGANNVFTSRVGNSNDYNGAFTGNGSGLTNLNLSGLSTAGTTTNWTLAILGDSTNTFQFDRGILTNISSTAYSATSPTSYALTTNAFAGPTNSLDMMVADQTYITTTPVSLTNILNYSASLSLYCKLTISNASAATVGFTIPAQWRTDDGLRQYYITNAQIREVWVNTKNSMTNCITIHMR